MSEFTISRGRLVLLDIHIGAQRKNVLTYIIIIQLVIYVTKRSRNLRNACNISVFPFFRNLQETRRYCYTISSSIRAYHDILFNIKSIIILEPEKIGNLNINTGTTLLSITTVN